MSLLSLLSLLSRRTVFRGALATGGALALGARPASADAALVLSSRPVLTHGLQSGDVTTSAATVWARADRPSRMMVEVSTSPDFRNPRLVPGALLLPDSDFTGKTCCPACLAGTEVYHRVTPVDLADPTMTGQHLTGHFRTVPRQARDVSFLWSGDLGGQAGASTPPVAGTASSRRCAGSIRTSTSATATTSTPTSSSRKRRSCPTAACGGTSSPPRSPKWMPAVSAVVDTTFGAQQVFVKAPSYATAATEFQFFGQISISAATRVLTAGLRDNSGAVLWAKDLESRR